MEIPFAFICDAADVAGGKVHAMGIGFDTIVATEVPTIHPVFYFVAQFKASITEMGEKPATLRLIDDDGQDIVAPVHLLVHIQPPTPGQLKTTGWIAWRFVGTVFPSYCEYSLHLTVSGHEMVRIPVRVGPASGEG